MVPQTELRDCMYACEEMLLAEEKTSAEVIEQMKNYEIVGVRRNTDVLLDSLRDRSGYEPLLYDIKEAPAPASLEFLKGEIDKYGPCIFMSRGHARILDDIEKTSEGYMLSVRDPFSGSFLKIKDHEEFWCNDRPVKDSSNHISKTDEEAPRYWQAVFISSDRAA